MDPATTQAVAKAAEESAKTTGKALEVVHDAGGYLRSVIGEVPADVVGLVGGAWLRERHIRLRDRLRRRTEQILRERDVQEAIELSPNVAVELIAGAQEESREELMELWARLLANAMDPNLNSIRQLFINAVKRMDPLDAVVLRYIHENKIALVIAGGRPREGQTIGCDYIGRAIGRRYDEVEVSILHLRDLGFFEENRNIDDEGDEKLLNLSWWMTAAGREFLQACYPESRAAPS